MRKNLYVLFAAFVLASLILAACGGATPEPVEPGVEEPVVEEPPEEEPMEEPMEKKTFVFGRGGDSVQLDPSIVTDGERSIHAVFIDVD